MLNYSSPLLPTYAAKGRFCFVPPRKRGEFPRLLRPLRAPSTHCDALRPISAEKPADFSERVHLFFRKSAYFQMGVVRFFFPSHCMLRTAAHFLPLPLAFASHFPHSLALSHAQRRATANSSAGGHELPQNFGAILPHSSRRKGRKRQLQNTFARNTSNTTLVFAHSYRSPIKK